MTTDSPPTAPEPIAFGQELDRVRGLRLRRGVPLAPFTRFGIGGPADLLAETESPEAFAAAVRLCREHAFPFYILGDGTNVIVADEGYRGLVLRFLGEGISAEGGRVRADAGAALQALVDFTIDAGLEGLETLAGIPGSVGAAVYGNAGAYGRSISESVTEVRFLEGGEIRQFDNAACEFAYRESIFKRNKDWMIFSCELALREASAAALRKAATEIMAVRDKKFPPAMRCAGSIFKNLLVKDLPPDVVAQVPAEAIRDGKVASAWFLERVGAKGMRQGGIAIADYHANLIYNTGGGTAAELGAIIAELKERVRNRFGFEVEEEVQWVG